MDIVLDGEIDEILYTRAGGICLQKRWLEN
jgi:hypothetical protein